MVDRIRELLGLEAKGTMFVVFCVSFAKNGWRDVARHDFDRLQFGYV
jgi:hypothetical protein